MKLFSLEVMTYAGSIPFLVAQYSAMKACAIGTTAKFHELVFSLINMKKNQRSRNSICQACKIPHLTIKINYTI